MSNILKAAGLDFILIRYYVKSILFTICIPMVFVLVNRSLTTGISFAMCFMAMSSSYTFTVAEKNDMFRFYGIVPVTKTQLVCGKYLHLMALGMISLVSSCIAQPFILTMLGETVALSEILTAALMGIILFITYIAFQIPGYYKYGAIKGRVFMYIPVVGFLAAMFVLEKVKLDMSSFFLQVGQNNFLAAFLIIIYLFVTTLFSVLISIRILKNKEW